MNHSTLASQIRFMMVIVKRDLVTDYSRWCIKRLPVATLLTHANHD